MVGPNKITIISSNRERTYWFGVGVGGVDDKNGNSFGT